MNTSLLLAVLVLVVSMLIVVLHDDRVTVAFLLVGYLGCAIGIVLLTQWMIRHVWR